MKHFSTLFRTIVAAAGLLLVGFAAYHGWPGAQEILSHQTGAWAVTPIGPADMQLLPAQKRSPRMGATG